MIRIIKKSLEILDKREKLWLIPLVLLMLIGAVLESLGITIIIPLVTGMINGNMADSSIGAFLGDLFRFEQAQSFLVSMIILLIVIFVVKNVFLLWQAYVQHSYTSKIRRRIQNRLAHYFMRRPYYWFLDKDSGNILRTITVDSDYYISLLNHLLDFFTKVIEAVVMVIVILLINPNITIILVLVLIGGYFVIIKGIRPVLRRYGRKYRESLGKGNSQVIEALRGIKSIKVSGKEQWFEDQYDVQVKDISKSKMMERALQGAPGRFIEAITVAAVLLYLLYKVNTGQDVSELVPILSAFALAASKLLPCVSTISNAISYAGYYEGSLNKVLEIDRTLKEEKEEYQTENPLTFSDTISLEDVCFSYPGSDDPVLDHVSIKIRKNSSVGIVGVSGGGKTTLADVILGLLKVQSGKVFIDGERADTESDGWKRLFAYIPQQVFMLSGSILENVTFGIKEEDIDEKKVWEALRIAQIDEFVFSLKDGLMTTVGESGVRLSGGQIQRLGIARAIYSDAPVIIFDEATSSLDFGTESALMDAISNLHGNKTLIIIAHRLVTIENCDVIYRVENGNITATENP